MFSGNLEGFPFELNRPVVINFSGFFKITNAIQSCVCWWFSVQVRVLIVILSKFFVVIMDIMALQVVICLGY